MLAGASGSSEIMDFRSQEPVRKMRKADNQPNDKIESCVATKRYESCWAEILSYIPMLADVFALIESCSFLRAAVKTFMLTAKPSLTIDRDCLDRYPIEINGGLYEQVRVSSLTISNITEEELIALRLYLQYVFDLHLRGMHIEGGGIRFYNLHSVKLTECVIYESAMDRLFAANRNLHLHLDNTPPSHRLVNTTTIAPRHLMPTPLLIYNWNTIACTVSGLAFGTNRANIRHLILERIHHYGDLRLSSGIESLRITSSCGPRLRMSDIRSGDGYPQLKSLSLETIESIQDFVKNLPRLRVDSLETLAMSHLFTPLKWLRRLKELKQLSFLLPIQTYQEEALNEAFSRMDNELIEVTYTVLPQPENEETINILNEDCLREILSYLTAEEVFNMAIASCRLKEMISKIDLSAIGVTVNFDEEFLRRHPLSQQLIGYEALGHSLSTLTLKVSFRECIILAPYLRQLRNLRLVNYRTPEWKFTDELIETFPMVEALDIQDFYIPIAKEFVTKLQPKLIAFYDSRYDHKWNNHVDFGQLHNLQEVGMKGSFLNRDLSAFWKQNQNLKALKLYYESDIEDQEILPNHVNEKNNWTEIANLESLVVLKIRMLTRPSSAGMLPSLMLVHIKELHLYCFHISTTQAILKCIGGQLEVLKFNAFSDPINYIELVVGFKNLRYLGIPQGSGTKEVMRCVKELPRLKVIEMDKVPEGLKELNCYLAATNRVLYLNGVKYPH